MKGKERFLAVVAMLLLIGAIKVGQELYHWYAFEDERLEIGRLEEELEAAALEVIRTQLRADTLRIAIEKIDEELGAARDALGRYERQVVRGAIPRSLEGAYRGELAGYNARVAERNDLFEAWRAVVDRNHLQVDRYNILVDSIRAAAARMGEPYYPIQTPAEIAARAGLVEMHPDSV